MDIKSLIRNPKKVQDSLQELPDLRLVTLTGCKIYIPVRFAERGLAEIGNDTYICGVYAIVVEDKYYAVSTVNAMLRIEPSTVLKIKIHGDEYFEFTFNPGATVVSTLNLVRTDTLVYRIYDEIIAKGKVPWYLGYEELGKIFDTARYHAGANIGGNSEVTELIISIIARDPKDKINYYRTVAQTDALRDSIKPAFISLRSVEYASTNTTTKLAGSYFGTGVISALVNPSERKERLESILTM
jgi:hypothetical protein